MKAPAYLAINPMGKVPALRHGEAIVTETAAICAYLADAFLIPVWHRRPATGFAPRITVGCSSQPVRWKPRQATKRWGSLSRRGGK